MAIAGNNIRTVEAIMARIINLEPHIFLRIMGNQIMGKIVGTQEELITGQADSKVLIIATDLETSNLLVISHFSLNQIPIRGEISKIITRETHSEIQKRTILVSRSKT